MNRKREAVFMGIGILAGLVLSGPATQAATTITATFSNQPIYVDGQYVSMIAYSIGGNNYVRLRDIGKAVDFGVTYDAASNTVQINSTQPCQEEIPQIIPGSFEERVQIALAQLKERYPDGTVYPMPYQSTSSGPYTNRHPLRRLGRAVFRCRLRGPFLATNQPTELGPAPARRLGQNRNAESYHVVVVTQKTDEYIFVTESGNHNKALWSGQYFRWWLEEQPHYICYTRYPQ